MSDTSQETEAKFYVRNLNRTRARLGQLPARLIQRRVLETNIRFDLPGAGLRAQGRVLRLRRDTAVRLTYKGASQNERGVLSRQEIEFVVQDFEKARQFLEALGYQKLLYYEKYRTTYELNDTHIMLDELPYGSFIEIEGDGISSIRSVADLLELEWDAAVATSYHELFDRVRRGRKLSVEDLSFENFAGMKILPEDLGVRAADHCV